MSELAKKGGQVTISLGLLIEQFCKPVHLVYLTCLFKKKTSQSPSIIKIKNDLDKNFSRHYRSTIFYTNINAFKHNFQEKQWQKSIFRLFPIISISQNFFSFFFLTLEKIGIDEKVICYHNISN